MKVTVIHNFSYIQKNAISVNGDSWGINCNNVYTLNP